jgi:hypothetical protein
MSEMASHREAEAVWYDGLTNARHIVRLRLRTALEIIENGGVVESWPYDTVQRADGPPTDMRLRSTTSRELARLVASDQKTMRPWEW